MTVVFTRQGLFEGARAILPLVPGAVLFGIALGMLARQSGLSTAETGLMSLLVFAGASQFLALQLWADPLPVLAIVVATAAVNARHLLMGAALAPWFAALPRRTAFASLFFMTDENWGVSMARFHGGLRDAAFLLGGGLVLYGTWASATVLGHLAAGLIADPSAYGIDALVNGVFLVLLLLQWRGRGSLLPWGVAIVTALTVEAFLPAGWHVLLGALAGSLAGTLAERSSEPERGR